MKFQKKEKKILKQWNCTRWLISKSIAWLKRMGTFTMIHRFITVTLFKKKKRIQLQFNHNLERLKFIPCCCCCSDQQLGRETVDVGPNIVTFYPNRLWNFSITFLAKKDFFFWVMVSFERQSCAQADKFLEFKIEEIKKYLDLFILLMTVSSNISDV